MSAPSSPRLHLIENLRGVAALSVLGFHSLNSFDRPGALHPALALLRPVTEFGYLGVSMFFAISGWCIAQRIQIAWQRGESPGHFALERFLRIFPVYWLCLVMAIGLRLLAAPVRQVPLGSCLPAGPGAWWGDLLLLQPYFGTTSYLVVSWSLVYELGFYALAAGALTARRWIGGSLWLVGTGLLLCLWSAGGPHMRWLLVFDRWPDFFGGMLAWWAARQTQPWLRRLGVAAILLLIVLSPAGPADIVRLAAVGTALLLFCAARIPRLGGFNWPSLAGVGAMSYSLYLIHLPVLSPYLNLVQRAVAPSQFTFIVCWLGGLALTLLAARAVYHWGEAPIERWRRAKFSSRRVPA
ncbi:MAG: acyltransferase family protein [Opitutales bacterium]